MRKILALVLTGAVAFGVVSMANAGEDVQKEDFSIKPTKLDKKKYKNVKLVNIITTNDIAGTNQPPKATRTVVDWGKQFKFNTKKVPYCKTDANGLGSAPTVEDAKAACGKGSQVSQDSGSSAVVRVGSVAGATEIPVDVVAFNENGNQLLLYSKPTGDFQGIPASILIGKLKKSTAGKKYGKALDVSIPPLAAGAISYFKVTIPKSKYVQARCKGKKISVQATTTFEDAPQTSDVDVEKCKPKKKKKK